MSPLSALGHSPAGLAVSRFAGWWLTELRDLIPDRMRPGNRAGASADIWLDRDTVVVERWIDGSVDRYADERPLERFDEESWLQLAELVAGLRTRIVLRAPLVHTLSLDLPIAARRRVRKAAALYLEEVSPSDPALLSWTVHGIRSDRVRVSASVTMVKTAFLDKVGDLLEAHGFAIPAIAAEANGTIIRLADAIDATGAGDLRSTRRGWLAAVLLLAAIPFVTAGMAGALALSNAHAGAILEPAVKARLAADRDQSLAERRREAITKLGTQASASFMLEELARRLPPSAWVQRIEVREDGSMSLGVDAAVPEGVRKAVRGSPILRRLDVVDEQSDAGGRMMMRLEAGR